MLSGPEYDFRQGYTGGKGHIAWGSCRIGSEWVQAGYASYSLGGYRIGPGGRIAGHIGQNVLIMLLVCRCGSRRVGVLFSGFP